jgi:hypothetical protein
MPISADIRSSSSTVGVPRAELLEAGLLVAKLLAAPLGDPDRLAVQPTNSITPTTDAHARERELITRKTALACCSSRSRSEV